MNMQTEEAIRYWPHVAPMLEPPRSKSAYRRLRESLDAVLDRGGADESNPLTRLADYLGELVADYEAAHMPIKEMPPREFLRELMKRHELTQKDLPEIGAQSVVSAVLNGKRELNARQIARLSKRFGLSADVFMP
jgi:HTH-type transcriptional regulator/antitoxin HigA